MTREERVRLSESIVDSFTAAAYAHDLMSDGFPLADALSRIELAAASFSTALPSDVPAERVSCFEEPYAPRIGRASWVSESPEVSPLAWLSGKVCHALEHDLVLYVEDVTHPGKDSYFDRPLSGITRLSTNGDTLIKVDSAASFRSVRELLAHLDNPWLLTGALVRDTDLGGEARNLVEAISATADAGFLSAYDATGFLFWSLRGH